MHNRTQYLRERYLLGWNMLGMDSWYSSIPVMLQCAYYGIRAIGTVSLSRRGLSPDFVQMKKDMKKERNASKGRKNTKKGGFEKGFFKARSLRDEPLVVVLQKDSKVMSYLNKIVAQREKLSSIGTIEQR